MKSLKTLLLLSVACLTALSAQEKIGYINMETIQAKYSEAKKLEDEQKKIAQKYENQLKKLEADYVQLGQDFQSQKLLLTQAKQQEKLREIQLKEQEIQRFRQTVLAPNGEMYAKIGELQKPVLDKILAAVEAVAKEKGLDFMLNYAPGLVLYTSEKVDYSNDVLAHLESKKGN